MAKLRAHGQEIGTIYTCTTAKRYMSDGHVLKNIGFGWKRFATVKDGIAPSDAYANAAEKRRAWLAQRPAMATYMRALHDLAGMDKRWKLHAAVQLMPDDCDGVWSEACDGYGDNISAGVDEIGELCRDYRAALAESSAFKVAVTDATLERGE